ncbi:MAG: SPOR domain-containing protein [Pseudomonadota bacterium]
MSANATKEPSDGGGAGGLLSAALWAAGSVGVIAVVMMWAFDLGSRNPADIPALSAEAPWRRAPDSADGLRIPGGDAQVYGPMASGPNAAATAVADAFGAPGAERPTAGDMTASAEAPPPLEAIAPDQGSPVSRQEFEQMAMAAAAEAQARGRRTILLDDPIEPLRAAADYQGSGAPEAPPNIGAGAEPPPTNAVFYEPDAAVADSQAAPRAGDGPPSASAAAVDAELDPVIPAPAPEFELASEAAPPDAERLASAAAQAAPESAAADQSADRSARSEPPAPPSAARGGPAAPAIYQVQLGALESVLAVETEWAQLRRQAPALLGPFELDVQPVNVGDARLYRLRIGAFESRTEAAQLCAQLRAREIDCFPASG